MKISEQEGNPAFGLKQRYNELMAVKDAPTLYKAALDLGKAYHNKGFSTKNLAKFQHTLHAIKDDLARMQGFLTNFILKADGEGVIKQY
jgi:hypothetical protein